MFEKETEIFLTRNELDQLNRIFNVVTEDSLIAAGFDSDNLESIYSILEKVRTGIEELDLDSNYELSIGEN